MTDPDEDAPYQVQVAQGEFQIADLKGSVVLATRDEAGAHQYAVLLNQAYRRGYKAGYRKGRSV